MMAIVHTVRFPVPRYAPPAAPSRRRWAAAAALLALLACLVGAPRSSAQTPWTVLRQRDGLLSDTVHTLTATSSGEVWIGTARGLNVWDGGRLEMASAGNGLPPGRVTAVAEADATTWVGTWGGGLGRLVDGEWQRVQAEASPLPNDWISALAADGEGLWAATYGGGLAYLRGETWRVYRREPGGLPSDWLTAVVSDGAGGAWVGTGLLAGRASVVHLGAAGRWIAYVLPDPFADEVTALALADDALWVGTRRGPIALTLPSGSWRVPEWAEEVGLVTAVLAEPDGNAWFGSLGGLHAWRDGALTTLTVADGLPTNRISALARDGAGRLWVGTLTRGVAVQGEVAAPSPARLPVVLVHGWRGPDSDRLEDSEFWFLARWLEADGFPAVYAEGISPDNTLHENARILREVIERARAEYDTGQVYVVAFSMGGLNTRAYLESTLYAGDVARAFILGTPHRGEHLWLPLLLWERLAWSREPSAVELMPLHAELFNETHGRSGAVPYTLVAGDARDADLPTLFRELPASDGLVSTWSALGPPAAEGNGWASGVERVVNEDIHAWGRDTMLLDLPTLLYPRDTYDAQIRPHLFGVGDGVGHGRFMAAPVDSYPPPVPDPRTAFRVGTVAPGSTVRTLPIPLGATERARVYLRWKGPPLEMHLIDPTGAVLTSDTLDGDAAEYLSLDFADFASYVLTDTVPGPWTLELVSPEDAADPTRYIAYAQERSPIDLTLSSDRAWYAPGEPVVITATVGSASEGGAVDVSSVQVSLYGMDGLARVVKLAPVPGGGPAAVWRGSILAPEAGGTYALLGQANGSAAGQRFERGDELLFGVRGDSARLTGSYRWGGEPFALAVEVGVDVAREGDYLLSLHLRAPDGPLRLPAHPVHLRPGEQRVPVPCLRGMALAGTWRVERALLLDIDGAGVLLDEQRDVALTAARPATREMGGGG